MAEAIDLPDNATRATLFIRVTNSSDRGTTVRFRTWPWDLVITLAYAVVAGGILLSLAPGALWALPLILVAPGYVLVAALFPGRGLNARLRQLAAEGEGLLSTAKSLGIDPGDYRRVLAQGREGAQAGRLSEAIATLREGNDRLRARLEDNAAPESTGPPVGDWADSSAGGLDWTARIILSFGLSIAIVALTGLALDLTPWGITLQSVIAAVLLFTLVVGLVAIARRVRLPPEDRLSADLRLFRRMSLPSTFVDKALTLGLVASILLAGTVLAYVALTPRAAERFTQFFLLDSNGTVNPTLYPTRLNVSEPGTVIIGLVNNESVQVNYEIRIDLVGVEFVYNPTTGLNETIERNRTTNANFSKTLENHEAWRQRYTFTIDAPGDWIVEFRLFRGGTFTGQYLQLRVQVLPGP